MKLFLILLLVAITGMGGATEVEQNIPEKTAVAQWMERANRGDVEAMCELGQCLIAGEGVKKKSATGGDVVA